jgi:adenylate cyclase, class 2
MPLEIEIKLKIDVHAPIVKRLRNLRARHTGTVREKNIFLDRRDHSLRAANSGLRVRFEAPERAPGTRPSTALLTFKGPPRKSGLRSRRAYDLTVTPADQLMPLLESLGFRQMFAFEKIRDSWQLAGCKIELDTLPHFGTFLEIEGPSEKAVRTVQKQLALDSLPAVKKSYAQMIAAHLATRRRKELRF